MVPDLRDVPLGDLADLEMVTREVVGRAAPGLPGVSVIAAAAAFQSAI